ncbi:vascular cell adhesion protein 1b [Brienomyrus brachyistius]|uniref:vascular cell adhesion protein 1b n=1 Tax=Brienomyrus brachyistius TaxID=42636 RepID=UPI0020B1F987|nr:vascular cell adhesion protein 1b [Brienomyrus brachyistius]
MSTFMFIWMFILPSADLFSVTLSPRDAVWRVGDTQVMKCTAVDCPGRAHIMFSRPGDELLFAETERLANQSLIHFAPVEHRHNYQIVCKITCDGLKAKQSTTTITVYSFPNDPVISGTTNLMENETRDLSCNVYNVSAPDYARIEWSLGDTVVHENTEYTATYTASSTYTITPEVKDNGKKLTCRATIFGKGIPEEYQTRETTEIVNVLYAPRDVRISDQMTVAFGENFTLTCEADGNPKPQVQWKKLGGSAPLATGQGQQKFVIEGATRSHAGEYECVVSNSVGRKTAKVAVIVQGSPRNTSIMVSPTGQLKEGDVVTISCLSDALPAGRVVLSRVSEDGTTELNSTSGSSTSITLSPAVLAHSGQYKCEASNQYGKQTFMVDVSVRAPPRNTTVEVFPSSQVHEGQNITICCKTVSFPPARVTLRKLDGDRDIYSASGTFLLQNVMATDAGSYLVNVTNDLGHQTEVFSINVLEKHTSPSTQWPELLIPTIGVMCTVVTASLIIYHLRKSRLNNSYEMAKSSPGPV